jgi:hypothetical protein
VLVLDPVEAEFEREHEHEWEHDCDNAHYSIGREPGRS